MSYKHSRAWFIVTWLLAVPRLLAQQPMLSPEVEEALKNNARQLSPITISWSQVYQSSVPVGEALAALRLPESNANVLFNEVIVRVSLQSGKIYSSRGPGSNRSFTGGEETFEAAFDGRIVYTGNPDRGKAIKFPQPALIKHFAADLAVSRPSDEFFDLDFFNAAGIAVPASAKNLHDAAAPKSILFSRMETGGRIASIGNSQLDGSEVLRVEVVADNPERRRAEGIDIAAMEKELRQTRTTEADIQREVNGIKKMRSLPPQKLFIFHLDPQMQYALRVQEERYSDGTLLYRQLNSDFVQLAGRKLWLPRKSIRECYAFRSVPGTQFKTPIISQVFKVSEISLDPVPDDQFAIVYTQPGTLITDNTVPGGLSYQIAAGPASLDAALASANADSRRGWSWTSVVIINVLILGAIGWLISWMLRRKGAHS